VARPRRRIDPEAERVLHQRQAELTALTTHPAWPTLVGEVERKRARVEKGILTRTLALDAPVDPIEMAYFRGLVDGIEWLVKVPPQAEMRLERFLREQGVLEGVEA
jgi:hypothetical protein